MNQKYWQNMYQANVNVNLMVKNVSQIKSETTINVGVGVKTWKNIMCAKKMTFGILLHVFVKMVNMTELLLVIQWLCVIKLKRKKEVPTKPIPRKSTEANFYILLAFLLTTIELLITVSIYWITYQEQQKHLLTDHVRNNKLK